MRKGTFRRVDLAIMQWNNIANKELRYKLHRHEAESEESLLGLGIVLEDD